MNPIIKVIICFQMAVLQLSEKAESCTSDTVLIDNGYRGIVVAINPLVPESPTMIDDIKNMMTDGSSAMFEATHKRAYIKEVTILVPASWNSGSYGNATTETYSLADIRISESPFGTDTPYAWTYTACGCGGDYINLTPNYVTLDSVADNYGPRGAIIVHEWGHYRWGVFDEYPTNVFDNFYLDASGNAEATRCASAITGRLANLLTGKWNCSFDPVTRLPSQACVFVDDQNQPTGLKTSMMYKQFVDKVSTFCHSDSSDPTNLHNEEAPNNQNRRCDYESTWDVIMKSPDFKNGANLPNPTITDTTPDFNVVRSSQKRIVFVMDVSGSMGSNRKLENMILATTHAIKNIVANGAYVGLISFSFNSTILSHLVEIVNITSRVKLAASLPTEANGGTGIGSGIQAAINILSAGGLQPAGGSIVVLTDGQENNRPMVTDITKDAISKNVVVSAVFIGLSDVNTNHPLVTLTKQTCGTWSYVDDVFATTTQLNNLLASLSQSTNGDSSSQPIQISNKNEELTAGSTTFSSVAVDDSLGKQTVFSFTWVTEEPTIELTPPNKTCIYSNRNFVGKTYCTGESIHAFDNRTKSVTFTIPDMATPGIWEYAITSNVSDESTATVTSISSDGQPVTVEVQLLSDSVADNEAATIFAKVLKGGRGILKASVNATILRPDHSTVKIELFDNGKGADIKKNDGVYSRYFANFNQQGRYSVEVVVYKDDNDEDTIANDDGVLVPPSSAVRDVKANEDGTMEIIQAVRNNASASPSIKGPLQRVAASAGLAYTGSTVTGDNVPPNKISDLQAHQLDLDEASAGVQLSFSAPGDDYDSGTASRYEIRFTYKSFKVMVSEYETHTIVSEENIIIGNLTQPKPAMTSEDIHLRLVDLPENTNSVRVSFAMRAYDEKDNPSEISNIAILTFFIVPPPIPQRIASTTATSSSTEAEVTTAVLIIPPQDVHLGIILGAIFGIAAIATLIIVALVIYCRRRRSLAKQKKDALEQTYDNPYQI